MIVCLSTRSTVTVSVKIDPLLRVLLDTCRRQRHAHQVLRRHRGTRGHRLHQGRRFHRIRRVRCRSAPRGPHYDQLQEHLQPAVSGSSGSDQATWASHGPRNLGLGEEDCSRSVLQGRQESLSFTDRIRIRCSSLAQAPSSHLQPSPLIGTSCRTAFGLRDGVRLGSRHAVDWLGADLTAHGDCEDRRVTARQVMEAIRPYVDPLSARGRQWLLRWQGRSILGRRQLCGDSKGRATAGSRSIGGDSSPPGRMER